MATWLGVDRFFGAAGRSDGWLLVGLVAFCMARQYNHLECKP